MTPPDPAAETATEAAIARWHGIAVPNHAARRFAAELDAITAAFEAMRDRPRFEDEPAGFEQALRDLAE